MGPTPYTAARATSHPFPKLQIARSTIPSAPARTPRHRLLRPVSRARSLRELPAAHSLFPLPPCPASPQSRRIRPAWTSHATTAKPLPWSRGAPGEQIVSGTSWPRAHLQQVRGCYSLWALAAAAATCRQACPMAWRGASFHPCQCYYPPSLSGREVLG